MKDAPELAIVGGTGMDKYPELDLSQQHMPHTRYGETSGPLQIGHLSGTPVVFLPRHGPDHSIPPHLINYRANIYALHQMGIKKIIAINAVGGIKPAMSPKHLCLPNQIIDYTWGREHTFADGTQDRPQHIDFSDPYDEQIRNRLIAAAESVDMDFSPVATYGCTQGPRLETAAEIDRLERDGCDIVGMTGMPEAALARELGVDYACIALVANRAAGRSDALGIGMDAIYANLELGMQKALFLLREFLVDA